MLARTAKRSPRKQTMAGDAFLCRDNRGSPVTGPESSPNGYECRSLRRDVGSGFRGDRESNSSPRAKRAAQVAHPTQAWSCHVAKAATNKRKDDKSSHSRQRCCLDWEGDGISPAWPLLQAEGSVAVFLAYGILSSAGFRCCRRWQPPLSIPMILMEYRQLLQRSMLCGWNL